MPIQRARRSCHDECSSHNLTHPAATSPRSAMAAAVASMYVLLISPPTSYHVLYPMTGVRATPLSSAVAVAPRSAILRADDTIPTLPSSCTSIFEILKLFKLFLRARIIRSSAQSRSPLPLCNQPTTRRFVVSSGHTLLHVARQGSRMASSISSSSLPQPNYHPHVKYAPATEEGQPAVNIPLLRELIRTVVCCASTPITLAPLALPPTSVIEAAHNFNGDVFFCCMRTQLLHRACGAG
jgi:hypothetical protein